MSNITYVVQRLNQMTKNWEFLTYAGTWSDNIYDAKTWQRVSYADKVSFKYAGALVVPHAV